MSVLDRLFTSELPFLCSLASISGGEGRSGSTGTVAFVRKDRVVVAYVGDSRVVSHRQPKVLVLENLFSLLIASKICSSISD